MLTDGTPAVGTRRRTVTVVDERGVDERGEDERGERVVRRPRPTARPRRGGARSLGAAAAAIVVTLTAAAAAVAVNLSAADPTGTGAGQLSAVVAPEPLTEGTQPTTASIPPTAAPGSASTGAGDDDRHDGAGHDVHGPEKGHHEGADDDD
jgi:hypothetical protein